MQKHNITSWKIIGRSLEDVFIYEELMSTAKETEFYRRESKLNPFVFFDLIMV